MGHGFHGYLKLPQGIKPGDSDKMRNYGKTMGYNQQQLRDIIGYKIGISGTRRYRHQIVGIAAIWEDHW
jgi:hypothetical protein